MSNTETRRDFLYRLVAASTATALPCPTACADEVQGIPQSPEQLWADFDPRKDPLETELIREWQEAEGVFQHVRFLVGTFHGHAARMTAVYGFPKQMARKVPAVMHIHGGGQRGSLHEVQFLVNRGYAALSVNWGGNGDGEPPFNAVDGAQPGDPNTDWGTVDPSQLNPAGYDSILPGPKQLFTNLEHPRNSNWYLLTLACRRGLTFLEQQPEVDADKLGVHGYSMGGNLTMYVAATDHRVRAAVPAVGGAGWRSEWHNFIGGKARLDHVRGDIELFRRTLSFENYAPLIRCPVLHRSATNDFHGWMDDVYRTNARITGQPTRYSWAPHLNHRLTPEVEVTMPLWFDQHLKDGPALPDTPDSSLLLNTRNQIPQLLVRPDRRWTIQNCRILYSCDPDPRARFWRNAHVVQNGTEYSAELPLHSADFPLFAFASVTYELPAPIDSAPLPGHRESFKLLTLAGLLHSASAAEINNAGVATTLTRQTLIDDFSGGMQDWYVLNPGNLTHQQLWTRKLTDPVWQGPDDAALELSVIMPGTNVLTFVVVENEWRSYRGPRKTFAFEREITGAGEPQQIKIHLQDFVSAASPTESLNSWAAVDLFGICTYLPEQRRSAGDVRRWNGAEAKWLQIKWV
ncbi:MAG: hypothetical protein RLZZ458_3437 [Planctomycetota bacterium]